MPQRPLRALIIALVLIVFFFGPALVTFYTNWLWFGEVGYQQVFATMLRAQGTLFTIVFALSALWLTSNLRLALGAIGNIRPVFTTREGLEVTLQQYLERFQGNGTQIILDSPNVTANLDTKTEGTLFNIIQGKGDCIDLVV